MLYEVHADKTIPGARVFRFTKLSEAMLEAARITSEHACVTRVLKLVGRYDVTPRWIKSEDETDNA
jgi:hypothetical protein